MIHFRKTIAAGLAALTLGAAVATTATPASAFDRHNAGSAQWGGGHRWAGGGAWAGREGWRHRGWGGPGPYVAGAIGGLALGAIAAGAANSYDCVANREVYDEWGNFAGYQTVRVPCY